MVFSSYAFILIFLPIVLGVYYLLSHIKNGIYQRLFLILASLFFYGYQNIKYVPLILLSIAVNYIIATTIQAHKKKLGRLLLILGILFNVFLIGYYKYYDFFIENINLIAKSDFTLKHIIIIKAF